MRWDLKLTLRDAIYIITLVVALTMTISRLDAMTRVNEAAVKSMQEILNNHEKRINLLEIETARAEGFRAGRDAGGS